MQRKTQGPQNSKDISILYKALLNIFQGPQATHKRGSSDGSQKTIKKEPNDDETAYELMLKQQQIVLQWQVENKNKYQMLLPKSTTNGPGSNSSGAPSPSPTNSGGSRSQTPLRLTFSANSPRNSNNPPTIQEVALAQKMLSRIDEMKVNELKSELKKRNLTVSGAKPQLIERLRPHLEAMVASSSLNNNGKLQITPSSSGTFLQPSTPSSPTTFVIVSSKENSPAPPNQQPGKEFLKLSYSN